MTPGENRRYAGERKMREINSRFFIESS